MEKPALNTSLEDQNNIEVMTAQKFSDLVDLKVLFADISLLDAVEEICTFYKIEYEAVKCLITKDLKLRLTVEAEKANLLKPHAIKTKLPKKKPRHLTH